MSLSFLKKIFSKDTSQTTHSLFDNAPFLSPWYFGENKPVLTKDGSNVRWKYIDKVDGEYVGVTTLRDIDDNVLGFINGYNYIHTAPDNTKFLIWNRATKVDTLNPCVTMELYDTLQLSPLDKSNIIILKYSKSKQPFYSASKPISTIRYFIDPTKNQDRFHFPNDFKIFDPFLVVAEYEGLYDGSQQLGNTLILEFIPKADIINIYPQDWFNKSDVDLGYQWITRAFRDKNGFIHGQGIRISDFILDETGTQLKK